MVEEYIAKAIQLEDGLYIPVDEQKKEFRSKYPRGVIESEIVSDCVNIKEGSVIIFKSTCYTDSDKAVYGTGHSQIIQGTGKFASAALEVCETSAIGRALRNLGIGFKTNASGASVNEVLKSKATSNPQVTQTTPKETLDLSQYNLLPNEIESTKSALEALEGAKSIDELKVTIDMIKQATYSPSAKDLFRKAKNLKIKQLKETK